MKVSLNTIKQYTQVDLPVDELVKKINQQLGGVEEVMHLGERYKDATIVNVVSCEKHPNADKLSVCEIDTGTGETVQVVCGAPNVRAGMFAVWLPPGSTVPASFNDKEPFVLGARELRGVISQGMLASAKELGLGDSHDGILEITENDLPPAATQRTISPGQSFAETFGLDDTIIDIENKMFTHRPDLFGQLGVAREIAGIQHRAFASPAWYKDLPSFNSGDGLELTATHDASTTVPRFMTVAIKDVVVGPSPVWLQCDLMRLGSKAINNIVDVTNYIMLLTAQPTHAYDYDKLRGHQLGVRLAAQGEKLTLLNHKTYELDESDIVIVDGEGPVGLAGIMGGGDSEVSDDTTNIVLEVASFDMYAVRKTSMRHGLFTDALTRFNKGQSPLQNPYVLDLLMKAVFDTAGGTQASQVYDLKPADGNATDVAVELTPEFINDRLGLQLSSEAIVTLLENVEFSVSPHPDNQMLVAKPPFWRTDIELPEDIVEEVGRLYGFDKLTRELPRRSIKPAAQDRRFETMRRVRRSLAGAGANEVLTYSFVHEKTMQHAEQNVAAAYRLSNALSPDLQYYRLSVLPSLLDKVHPNIKAGHGEFMLFEIGKGHNKQHPLDNEDLPSALEMIDLVYASKKARPGAAFYMMRRTVTQLALDLQLGELVLKPIAEPMDYPLTAPFEHTRSALLETREGVFIGIVGELKRTVAKNFKLPEYVAAASLDFAGIVQALTVAVSSYTALSRYPKVSQDISLRVPTATLYRSVYDLATSVLESSELGANGHVVVEPQAIYQPPDGTTKTVTLHIEVTSYERTLTDNDVVAVLDEVARRAGQDLQAERV